MDFEQEGSASFVFERLSARVRASSAMQERGRARGRERGGESGRESESERERAHGRERERGVGVFCHMGPMECVGTGECRERARE